MIVLDLSVLRNTPSIHLRAKDRLLIPEITLHEIATTTSGQDQAIHNIQKLLSLSKSNMGLVYIGNDASHLMHKQKDVSHRLHAGACINHSSTRFLRLPYLDSPHDWASVFHQVSKTGGPTIDQRKFFLSEISKAYGSFIRTHDPTWLREAQKLTNLERDALIARETSDPNVLKMLVHQMLRNDAPESKYLKSDWLSQILARPNQFAIGKIARLTAWFCALQVVENRADFKNAAEDMQYIFLSSYAGRLATEDKGMQRATMALWPNTKVVTTTQVFKERNHE